jgi:hypothetical protein
MCGHAFHSAFVEVDAKIYPGMNEQHGLISRQFFRSPAGQPFLRHDLRVWESAAGHEPLMLHRPSSHTIHGRHPVADDGMVGLIAPLHSPDAERRTPSAPELVWLFSAPRGSFRPHCSSPSLR